MFYYIPFESLKGMTFSAVKKSPIDGYTRDHIHFIEQSGKEFVMFHEQDCCERVYIEDIVGDLQYLVGSPIIRAEESVDTGWDEEGCDRFKWTFYRIATAKGTVVIRWYGSSNGYYSESVDLVEIAPNTSLSEVLNYR